MTPRALALLLMFAAGPVLAQEPGPDPPYERGPEERPQSTASPIAPLVPRETDALDVDEPFLRPEEQVFISPAGEPFRSALDQPYPVAAWFARAEADRDGVLTQAEFIADAVVFFDSLDKDRDGLVDGFENTDYEKDIAPEISGIMRRPDRGRGPSRRSAWNPFSRADDMGGGPSKLQPGGRGRERTYQRTGAGQYGLLDEPHPVRGADADLDQKVSRKEAEAAARQRFQKLDADGDGRVILADLPATPAQIAFRPLPEKR